MRGQRRAGARARRDRALELQAAGLSLGQIAEAVGVAPATVWGYLRAPERLSPVSSATVERLVTNAAGLVEAANQIGGVIDPTQEEVDRWANDLTQAIWALSKLRTRLKEGKK